MRRLFLLLGICFLLTGCNTDPLIEDQNVGFEDPRHVENQVDDDSSFIEGELTDIADMNPNFPDTEPNDTDRTGTIDVYRDKLMQQVEESDKFEPRFVNVYGTRATVHVTANGSYTKQDVENLLEKLEFAVPRYKIKIDVD